MSTLSRVIAVLGATLLCATAALAAAPAAEEEESSKNPYTEAQGAAWAKESKSKSDLGHRFTDAWSLYSYLKKQAKGGTKHTIKSLPDWSGLWTRDYRPGRNIVDAFQDLRDQANLTPEYFSEWKERQAKAKQGIMYDPLSACEPAGFPRWLTSPFMRQHVVTPDQTWLLAEQMNELRMVYTDGRDHIPEADRYPLWEGDSIGFWDGPRLVVHTNQLREGIFARNSPRHSEQTEVVEVWERTSKDHIDVDVWIYDKLALKDAWFVKVRYVQQPNKDKFLRIRQWECTENPNNQVIQDKSGASVYRELDFGGSEKK